MIFNGENVAEQFEKLFREYKKVLASTGGVTMTSNPVIQNPEPSETVSGDEYASIFKKIIDERGKNILKERLFLSLLADYKVFKEKRFLRPFLETMTEEGYWSELTDGNPSVDTLNRIKKKFHWRLLKSVNAKLLNSVFMLVTRFSGLQTLSHFSNDYIGVGALKLGSPIFHECRTIHFQPDC